MQIQKYPQTRANPGLVVIATRLLSVCRQRFGMRSINVTKRFSNLRAFRLLRLGLIPAALFSNSLWAVSIEPPLLAGETESLWTQWYRPVDSPVFSTAHGNNHDAILFREPGAAYPYHLIISHNSRSALLWRSKTFSWSSADWELVSDSYQIAPYYEFDDGVKVGDTYYIYEEGFVYTYSGDLADSSGKWERAGTFPKKKCDDIAVFYEDGVFHIFGEFGDFPHGYDGTLISHFTSTTGLGDWTLVNDKAVDPNPDGGDSYGVGDPTLIKVDDIYYLFCDIESKGNPYRVVAWKTESLNEPFTYLGVALAPRSDRTGDWDNHRVQDADIAYIPELGRLIMVCNMKDTDGSNPDNVAPFLSDNATRVIGTFYSKATDEDFETVLEGMIGQP